MGLLDLIEAVIDRFILGEQPETPEFVVGWAVACLDKGRLTSVGHGYGLFQDEQEATEAAASLSDAPGDLVYIVIPIYDWNGS